jgi:pSer/pThr/pTyr-binding forkhead associated (FHA) protein
MPSVYCTACGEPNSEGARFCSQCGTPLIRGLGERGPDTTSTISIAGTELAEDAAEETDADSAAVDALPAGTALLVVRRGPNAGSRFLLDADLTLVGRHPDSDIFLDDVTVSRRHAEFYRQGGRFTVRDVGSLNGTYVNRERIEETGLSGGDEVQIGKFRLVFLLGPRSQAEFGGGGSRVGG